MEEVKLQEESERGSGREKSGGMGGGATCEPVMALSCITSLRCFSTDDIVGLGGGLALGMMSLITNQRAPRPVESGQLLRLM